MLLALAWTVPAGAAQVSVSLRADAAQVRVGESVTLTIGVESGAAQELPALQGLAHFALRQRFQTANMESNINGRIEYQKREYNYQLEAVSEGADTVTARVRVGGADYESDPVTVAALPPPQPIDVAGEDRSLAAREGQPIFLSLRIDPPEPVVGQQVIADLVLYERRDLHRINYRNLDVPEFEGFTRQELLEASLDIQSTERVGEMIYRTYLVSRWALFPTSTGEKVIGGVKLEARSGFQRQGLETPPLRVNVRPLPLEGRPADFQGAIGDFTVQTELDRDTAPAGEPLTLKIIISGEGNVGTLQRPGLSLGEALRIYGEEEKAEIVPSNERVTGRKTFEVILVADRPGDYEIPVRFPYYDVGQNRYRDAATDPVRFTVTEADGRSTLTLLTPDRQALALGEQALIYIRGDRDRLRRKPAASLWPVPRWLAAPLFVWPLVTVVVAVWQRRRRRLLADRVTARSRRAMREARLRLRQAERLLRHEEPARFYAEMHHAVIGFIADKLAASAPGLEKAELSALLREKGIRETSIESLAALWQQSDAVRFGGVTAETSARKASLQQARRLLASLAQEMSR